MHATMTGPAETDGRPENDTEQAWPSPKLAWLAVSIFAFSLMFLELDRGILTLLIQPIKEDLQLTDMQMSYLLGFSTVLFYALVGLPMSRLVDIYPRNIVLSLGVMVLSTFTTLCGVIQNYWQFFACRVMIGAGGTVNGPGTYSMIADYFPPHKLPRAIAVLQIGFFGGLGLSLIGGGALVNLALSWPDMQVPWIGLIHNWQFVFLIIGVPGVLVALLVRMVPEPPRRGTMQAAGHKPMPIKQVFRELSNRRGVYVPMFIGLALSSVEMFGIGTWRAAFIQREYGWSPGQIGLWSGLSALITAPPGLLLGTWLTEKLAKRHADAPLRAVVIVAALAIPFSVLSPLMPTPELCILMFSISSVFGTAGSIPQNAALQTVTPNEMRGQVTALYLFMFTVVGGGMGATFLTLVSHLLGGEHMLGRAMSVSALVVLTLSTLVLSFALRPYAREMASRRMKAAAAA